MDQDNILKYWARAKYSSNSNSHPHPQNQELNQSLPNPVPHPNPVSVPVQNPAQENEDQVKLFERTIQEAKLNLMRSLRLKLSNVTESSQTEILNLKKRLHDSEIRNSELSQENSKLRGEKRRCELSSEMAQVSASILERQLQEMTRKKTELESTVEEKTRENSALQFLLEEKEAQVYKMNHSILPFTREKEGQNTLKVDKFTPFPPQTKRPQEQIEMPRSVSSPVEIEISNPTQVKIERCAQFTAISNDEEENTSNNQFFQSNISLQHSLENSPFSPQPSEHIFHHESCTKYLCENPSTSCNTQQVIPYEKQRQSEVPQIEHQVSASEISSSKTRESVNPPKRAETRFEKSVSLQLMRDRAILRPSPLTAFESHDEDDSEDEPLTKRSRTFSGASSSSTSASTKSSSSIESVLNIPEIYRTNYGFTNNWELENCSHARDFWYDSEHSNISKFLIRFYDDEEYQKEKLLHVKQQKNLEEPKIKFEKLRHMEKKFESLSKKSGSGTEFCLFLDVRDFNIFHNKITFFKDFGQFVTHFSFGRRLFSFDEVSASQLLNFILEKFPNLEYFAINDGMLKKIDEPLKITSTKKLEKLKTIRLMTIGYKIYTSLIIELLLHAPALEKIYGLPLHCLSEIELYFETVENSNSKSNLNLPPWCKNKGDKISMDFIKEITVIRNIYDEAKEVFRERPNTFFTDISTLNHLNTPLEVVDVRTYFIRNREMRSLCVQKWSKILNSIQTHVKSLKIEPYQIKNFPQLENLHSLHFDMDVRHFENNSYSGYFPPGFDVKHNFPQLKTVEIGLNEKSSQFLNGDENKLHNLFRSHFPLDVFRHLDTFIKVERLNLTNFAPPTCILNLKALFPRITILQLTLETKEMSNVLPLVYKFWPGLKQLILAVTFSSKANYNLDSAFTGIHFSQCKILHRQIQDKDLSLALDKKSIGEAINKYKIQSSIQDLKDLTLLKMVLYMRETDKFYGIRDCLMTPVSGVYGFGRDQMPSLKVVVGFDERMTTANKQSVMKLLEPMKSYLTIDD